MSLRQSSRTRVLVLGGYGVFGGRLTQLIAELPDLDIAVGGRRLAAAQRFCDSMTEHGDGTLLTPLELPDIAALRRHLDTTDTYILANCVGPYQGQDYAIAEAAIAAGAHYVDLADGREFVAGFARLDDAAQAAGVLMVTGASTLPGLSAAVVDALRADMTEIESIETAIAPGMQMDRGDAVVRAILGYVGKPFEVWHNGAWQTAHGWQGLRSCRLTAGERDTGKRWLAACDVPDLALFPERYTGVQSVTFRAGLEIPWVHFGLWGLSWLVRAGLLPGLTPLTGVTRRMAAGLSALGTGRGGMYLDLTGRLPNGQRVTRRWTIIADSSEGPWIPVLPAFLVIEKLISRHISARGARACLDLFALSDFEALTQRFDMETQTTETQTIEMQTAETISG